MPVDGGLLAKCEQFLLHPTVRALSLAQRVDFLEQKGLSPEQITQCLKKVEQRNGLSQLARRSHELPAVNEAASSTISSGSRLLRLAKKYGAVALLLTLLGVGYTRYRRQQTEQQLLTQHSEHTQQRGRRSARVEALLDVVKKQQQQYEKAAELLRRRAEKLLDAQQKAHNLEMAKKVTPTAQFEKSAELQALQAELMQLKSAVMDAYMQPTIVEKVVEKVKEIPIVLRPTEPTATPTATTRKAVTVKTETTVTKHRKAESAVEDERIVKDQTTMSLDEIHGLLEGVEFGEELSTARSYRLLFATE